MRINHLALREIRTRSGLTQTALAAEVGLHRGNYAQIERGSRACPTVAILEIAKVLGVPVGAIVIDPNREAGAA